MLRLTRSIGGKGISVRSVRPVCWRLASTRLYSTPPTNDISKQPSLNQFQNMQNPPQHFSQTISQDNGYQAPLGAGPPPPIPGFPPQTSDTRGYKVMKYTFLFFSVTLTTIGLLGLYLNLQDEILPKNSLESLQKVMEAEKKGRIGEAIKECQTTLKLFQKDGSTNYVNVNYTGIIIKLAELYEFQGEFDKATTIYKEMAESHIAYVANLDDNVPQSLVSYDLMISRMLVAVNRFATLASADDARYAEKLLLFAITKAQKRIVNIYPPFMPFLNQTTNQGMAELIGESLMEKYKDSPEELAKIQIKEGVPLLELPIFQTQPTKEWEFLSKFKGGWPDFVYNLLIARDTYAEILMGRGNFREAVMLVSSNANIAKESCQHPVIWCLTITKLAVIYRLLTEVVEIDQKSDDIAEVFDAELVDTALNNVVGETKRLFEVSILIADQINKQSTSALSGASKSCLDRCVMVSSAGLGDINQRAGKRDEALQMFQRAKVLAAKHRSEQYLNDVTTAINKLESTSVDKLDESSS